MEVVLRTNGKDLGSNGVCKDGGCPIGREERVATSRSWLESRFIEEGSNSAAQLRSADTVDAWNVFLERMERIWVRTASAKTGGVP